MQGMGRGAPDAGLARSHRQAAGAGGQQGGGEVRAGAEAGEDGSARHKCNPNQNPRDYFFYLETWQADPKIS